MKIKFANIISVCLLSIMLFASCGADDLTSIGTTIQPTEDLISTNSYATDLTSQTRIVDSVYVKQDSLLLGSFTDKVFGTAIADIMTQLVVPGKVLPRDSDGFTIDSTRLNIIATSYVGDGNSMMRLHVYQLNKAIFEYNERYPSNINVSDYCDLSKSIADAIFTPNKGNRGYPLQISIKLSDEFTKSFIPDNDNELYLWSAQDKFNKFFPGLYITTDFGSAAMLNIPLEGIILSLFYHYGGTATKSERVNLRLGFNVSREVVRVNRIQHPDRQSVVNNIPDTLTFVSSPANFYTQINVPLRSIWDELKSKTAGKKMVINSVLMNISAYNLSHGNYLNLPATLLAVKSDSYSRFFDNREIPTNNDTVASFGGYATKVISEGDTAYNYSFELSKMIATEFQRVEKAGPDAVPSDSLSLLLVPITVSAASTSYGTVITGASHFLPISGVGLSNRPRLKILYNGF